MRSGLKVYNLHLFALKVNCVSDCLCVFSPTLSHVRVCIYQVMESQRFVFSELYFGIFRDCSEMIQVQRSFKNEIPLFSLFSSSSLVQDEKAEGFISLPEFRIDRAIECRRKQWVNTNNVSINSLINWFWCNLWWWLSSFFLTFFPLKVPSRPAILKLKASFLQLTTWKRWTGKFLHYSPLLSLLLHLSLLMLPFLLQVDESSGLGCNRLHPWWSCPTSRWRWEDVTCRNFYKCQTRIFMRFRGFLKDSSFSY